jgi:hypothetical protein
MSVGDGDVLPTVRFDSDSSPSGGTVHVQFEGAPGAGLLVLWSGDAGLVPFQGPGFGAWYVDPADPWLNSIFTGSTMPLVPLDASGAWEDDYTLPLGVEGVGMDGSPGWTFQTMDLGTLTLSAPFRLETF